jgi:hypothetical protein
MNQQLVHNGDSIIQAPNANIHGIYQCCSAALLHGVSGYCTTARFAPKDTVPGAMRTMDPAHCGSFAEYKKERARRHQMFGMPYDHAMCAVLEILYNKAKHGEGGSNMYASSSYATKTWFIADRRRTEGSVSCMNFMLWLQEQGVQQVGRIHISPWRDGAHGGECKGGVYAPNLTRVKELLDRKLAELNAHADWVFFDYFGLHPKQMGENYVADEVGAQW